MTSKRVELNPALGQRRKSFTKFCAELSSISSAAEAEAFEREIWEHRKTLSQTVSSPLSEDDLKVLCAQNLALDLVGLGYEVTVQSGRVFATRPDIADAEPHKQKQMVRKSQLIERNAQLRDPSVVDFIESMERRYLTKKGWHSIFSLMRDGAQLAHCLGAIAAVEDDDKRADELRVAIQPYLQFVEEGAKCEHTGLLLQNVWRYFRHTWTNAYKSTPGRSVMILVRDAAVQNHPVIGIAALGSSISQQRGRDRWIGWDGETVVESLRQSPTTKNAAWLTEQFRKQLDTIYTDDLRAERTCTRLDIEHPTAEVIQRLEIEKVKARERHRRYPHAAHHKSNQSDVSGIVDWEAQARTHLFRSKRCEKLAALLRMRMVFAASGFDCATGMRLKKALNEPRFANAIHTLVRMIKADRVGVDMMDIVVCGAIAPYNAILGGKLVSMLLASPEVVHYYNCRYAKHVSVIASAMKGTPVIKKPNLTLLATTSLYGSGSSQYNRVAIPAAEVGGKGQERVLYRKIDLSIGFGTYHISSETLKYAEYLLARKASGRKVNSIFGEGVNPRMRKIRDAFEELSLPADELLQHENARVVYGVALAKNVSDILLGRSDRPVFFLPQSNPPKRSELIADYWRRRWLLNRIKSKDVLAAVAQHELTYPVMHGARVPLPTNSEATEDEVFARYAPALSQT